MAVVTKHKKFVSFKAILGRCCQAEGCHDFFSFLSKKKNGDWCINEYFFIVLYFGDIS